jgi:hypothetical protein
LSKDGERHSMITLGSVTRDQAAARFPFLAARYRGRRTAIREVTHRAPELVFWVSPDGALIDARDGHLRHPPKGRADILKDAPAYGGYLRGRVARYAGDQLIVVYCAPEALADDHGKIAQLLTGFARVPIPIDARALVISDNGDLYGTLADLHGRVG